MELEFNRKFTGRLNREKKTACQAHQKIDASIPHRISGVDHHTLDEGTSSLSLYVLHL